MPGLYRVKSGTLSTLAHVGPLNSKELTTVAATEDLIKPVLAATGGGAFWTGSTKASDQSPLPRLKMLRTARVMHGSDWMALRERDAYVVKGVRQIPLFSGFLALAALLGLIALTWYREGH